MIDLSENDYNYVNLQIVQIRRMIDNMIIDNDGYSDSEIVSIALELMRILIDYSVGICHVSDEDEEEWDSFLNAQNDESSLISLINDLKKGYQIKNELLTGIADAKSKKEIYEFITEYKDSYHG